MSKILLLTYISLVFALTGCTTISENKAEQLIIEEYSNQIGEATIISTEKVDNEYLIK